jgi:N-acetyl-anhydromuramyl-L-alanine amidase AmpD
MTITLKDLPLTQAPMPQNQWINEDTKKSQIYLHHTAGNNDPYAVIDWWNSTAETVGTSFVIARHVTKRRDGKTWKDGDILQCFPSSKWSWHLGGVKALKAPQGSKSARALNAESIGIEVCNFGFLSKTATGQFKAWTGLRIPDDQVCELATPYKGYKFYQKYTDAQIESTRKLLLYLCDRWDIDKTYKGSRIFDIDVGCFKGENGIFTHPSVRKDKFDVYPYPPLVQMLQSL